MRRSCLAQEQQHCHAKLRETHVSIRAHRGCTRYATMEPLANATAATMAPRPNISSPARHHLALLIIDLNAPTVKSASIVRRIEHAKRLSGSGGIVYGMSGTNPAATKATNVAAPCLNG